MGKLALAARGQLGAVQRRHPDDKDRIADARRELATAKIADYIQKTVDAAPPLTDDQRRRLAALLQVAS